MREAPWRRARRRRRQVARRLYARILISFGVLWVLAALGLAWVRGLT